MSTRQEPNIKILLVSNDPLTIRPWTNSLSQSDFKVITVDSAEEALACWVRESFALTIIDIDAPSLDGIELCRQLRTQTSAPILLLSYSTDRLFILKVFEAEVDGYIVKPASPSLFLAWTRTLLRRFKGPWPEIRV